MTDTTGTTRPRRRDATWLVALGAALWGSDALLRIPLVGTYPASTIVFLEHVVSVLVTLPWLLPALRGESGPADDVDSSTRHLLELYRGAQEG